jgi:HlyD family secretion protein
VSRRKRWVRWVRAIVIVLALAGSGLALYRFRHTGRTEDLPLATARQGEFLVLVRCRGELTASRSVQLLAPLDVPDLQIVSLAPVGAEVQAGQIVIRFDPSRSKQDLKEKTAALNQAQASLDQAVAQARIAAEQDKLDLEKAQYEMEKARLEASKQAIVSPIKGQESEIDLTSAEEKVKLQQSTIALHAASDKAKIASQTRLRDQARNELAIVQERLKLMDVKSPIRGVINYVPNFTQGG